MTTITTSGNHGIESGDIIVISTPDNRWWRKLQYNFISFIRNKHVSVPSITEHRYINNIDSSLTMTISSNNSAVEV